MQLVIDAILHSIKCSLEFQLQEEEAEVCCYLLYRMLLFFRSA